MQGGLRLDECSQEVQTAIHDIIKASISAEGFEKVLGCCKINEFLGNLVNGSKIMNKASYNFKLFGNPSPVEPWGFTFFGHHLCLAVLFRGRRMVIGPTFVGAEPNRIDEGPHKGLRLFEREEKLGLELMQSLPSNLQEAATFSHDLDGQALANGRWDRFDGRQLCGARQDNRVVPSGMDLQLEWT